MQQTAYGMRISDWSSDVWSSDLRVPQCAMSWHGGGAGHVASDINDGCCKPLARRRAFVFICNQLSGMGFCCVAALTVRSGVVRFGPAVSWLFCETAHDNAVRNVVSVEGWGAFGGPEIGREHV